MIRKLTVAEVIALTNLSYALAQADPELGDLAARLAGHDDDAFPRLYDRLLACGYVDCADRVRRLVEG